MDYSYIELVCIFSFCMFLISIINILIVNDLEKEIEQIKNINIVCEVEKDEDK